MPTNRPLSLFISSKMVELAEVRRAVKAALQAYRMYGWLIEDDGGARPEPVRSTFLGEVAASDIYIGLFWLGYGPYTIEEFDCARQHGIPCLIYIKDAGPEQRDPRLQAFLTRLKDVEAPGNLTTCPFQTTEQLVEHIQQDVLNLLTGELRKDNKAVPTGKQGTGIKKIVGKAGSKSIVVGVNNGTITQHNT